jgi:hypothetical protein
MLLAISTVLMRLLAVYLVLYPLGVISQYAFLYVWATDQVPFSWLNFSPFVYAVALVALGIALWWLSPRIGRHLAGQLARDGNAETPGVSIDVASLVGGATFVTGLFWTLSLLPRTTGNTGAFLFAAFEYDGAPGHLTTVFLEKVAPGLIQFAVAFAVMLYARRIGDRYARVARQAGHIE